jgi:hypothetical protein
LVKEAAANTVGFELAAAEADLLLDELVLPQPTTSAESAIAVADLIADARIPALY